MMAKPKTRANPRRVQAVVERLLGPYELWKSGQWEWRCRCPFHAGAENPTQLRVRFDGRWRCYSCGAYGQLENLVMRLEGLSYGQAVDYVHDMPAPFLKLDEVLAALEGTLLKRTRPAETPNLPNEADLALYRQFCPRYLTGRGFTESALQAYEIGYDQNRSKIVIPVRDVDRKLIGITLRADFDGMWGPKYFHERFEKNKHLYGFYRWARKVVPRLYLVEGQLDVVRMYQLGLPACAVLGSSISDQQVALLQDHARCDQISLAFDNDEVGRKAVEDTARKLIRTRFVRGLEVAVYPGHDPGDLRDKKSISNVSWFSRRI